MKRKAKRYSGEDGESEVIDLRDNPNSSVGEDTRARAMKYVQSGKEESETKPAPKAAVKSAPKPAPKAKPEPVVSKSDKEDPDMVKKAYADAAKMNAENAAKTKAKPKEDKEDPIAAAKAMREQISGKKDSEAPKLTAEPKSIGKRFREFFGSKYKSGGSVRSSASSRGDGIATKGHTRGKIY